MSALPDKLILFDGVCNLCAGTVQFVIRHERAPVFRFASIQSDLGRRIFSEHNLPVENAQSILVTSGDRILSKSDAIIEIVRHLKWPWRIGVLLSLLPRILRDWGYSIVANNRYQWFGKKDSCMIPTEDIKARFLE